MSILYWSPFLWRRLGGLMANRLDCKTTVMGLYTCDQGEVHSLVQAQSRNKHTCVSDVVIRIVY